MVILRDTDTIIFNTAQRVEVALKRAKYEAETNYIPNPRHQYIALGEDFKALIQGQLDAQRRVILLATMIIILP